MKRTLVMMVMFLAVFGFCITGAMAQATWTWSDPITLTVTAPDVFVDIEAYPDYTELSGSFNGTTFEPIASYLGGTLPSTLQFSVSDVSSPLKSVTGPNGVVYVIDGDTVGFQLPQATPTAFAQDDQPFIPTLSGEFISIAVGSDGTLYVLFQTTTEPITQYLLQGTPPMATVRFTPRKLNLGSQGNWVTCKISELPNGYSPKDINLDSLYIVAINDTVLDELSRIGRDSNGPANNHSKRKLMVKFDRGDLATLISDNPGSEPNSAKITVSGYSQDGSLQFYGNDTINTKVPKKPKKK